MDPPPCSAAAAVSSFDVVLIVFVPLKRIGIPIELAPSTSPPPCPNTCTTSSNECSRQSISISKEMHNTAIDYVRCSAASSSYPAVHNTAVVFSNILELS